MKIFGSQKGVALILAIILGLVSVIFLSGLFLMITTGAKMSGAERGYTEAVEAARGGATFILKYLKRSLPDSDLYHADQEANWLYVREIECLKTKRDRVTSEWLDWGCSESCSLTSEDIAGVKGCYDLRLTAGNYEVYTKIIDTKIFETNAKNKGYLYTVHILSESTQNLNDKAWIVFLYRVLK